MRKIIFHLTTDVIGTDGWENALVDDDTTDEELNEEAWERAIAHAEMYGIYPSSERPEDYDGEEADGGWGSDIYSDDICGVWYDYDPEEHDGHVAGGGEWDWKE